MLGPNRTRLSKFIDDISLSINDYLYNCNSFFHYMFRLIICSTASIGEECPGLNTYEAEPV